MNNNLFELMRNSTAEERSAYNRYLFGKMRNSTPEEQQLYKKMLDKYSTVIEGINIFNMGDIEMGYCDICHKRAELQRKYYNYPINCECCGGQYHFEIVKYCKDCKPIPPHRISAIVKPIETNKINPDN